ncbi:SAM-dependent methyltransferase, partial [Campylobacter jejuni]|nr:SAM-dependent methyltransferase [Campylobacter jejuni]
KLYKNKYFKWIKLQTQSLEADNKLIDKLFIIEGERI